MSIVIDELGTKIIAKITVNTFLILFGTTGRERDARIFLTLITARFKEGTIVDRIGNNLRRGGTKFFVRIRQIMYSIELKMKVTLRGRLKYKFIVRIGNILLLQNL